LRPKFDMANETNTQREGSCLTTKSLWLTTTCKVNRNGVSNLSSDKKLGNNSLVVLLEFYVKFHGPEDSKSCLALTVCIGVNTICSSILWWCMEDTCGATRSIPI
jgi:hypothetical protein